ncbi:MAG: hypothetical protein R3C28_11125 [Pirellulaceae bacterium]
MKENAYASPSANTSSGREIRFDFGHAFAYLLPVVTILWTCFFYAYAFRVIYSLGRWPGFEEHGDLDETLYQELLSSALFVLFFLIPIWSLTLGVCAVLSKAYRTENVLRAVLITWIVILVVVVLDPGGHFAWFLG